MDCHWDAGSGGNGHLLCRERLRTVRLSGHLVPLHHYHSADALSRHGLESPVLIPVVLLVIVFPDVLLDHIHRPVLLPGSQSCLSQLQLCSVPTLLSPIQ